MSPVVLILALMLLRVIEKTSQQQFQLKDESTDVDLLCGNPNITMTFSNINLDSIGENFIASPIVTCLELKQNGIREVNAQTFDNVPNLKYLQMSFNSLNLNDIFSNCFKNLEVLLLDNSINLDYSRVHIDRILPRLRKLFLRNNGIDSLAVYSQEIFPSLTHLYFSENNLSNDDFSWLPESLEYLDLTSNSLISLTLKNLYNLKHIFIDQSHDRSLQIISFENLTNLKYLSASSNQINEILPQTFLNISSLEYLDLSYNNIQYIEEGSFDTTKELQFLNLSNNAIEIIQSGLFDELLKLKMLNLEKNSIKRFPLIENLTVLELIALNCNKLKTIISGTFAKMPLLETLLLHDNEITNIDQEAFLGLEKLKVLTLSNNKLSVLPQYWLEPLLNLEELDLAGNHFIHFGNLALSASLTLKNVYLSNQMLFIETASLMDLMPINATINLDANFNFVETCRISQYRE